MESEVHLWWARIFFSISNEACKPFIFPDTNAAMKLKLHF